MSELDNWEPCPGHPGILRAKDPFPDDRCGAWFTHRDDPRIPQTGYGTTWQTDLLNNPAAIKRGRCWEKRPCSKHQR